MRFTLKKSRLRVAQQASVGHRVTRSLRSPAGLFSVLAVISSVAFSVSYSTPAYAQESQLVVSRAEMRKNPSDPKVSLALGRALTRAGHPADAIVELHRGMGLWNAQSGEIAFDLHWELARAHLAKRELGNAIVQCQVVREKTGGTAFGRACAAETWLLPLRASEAHAEVKEALKTPNIPPRVRYSLHVSEGGAYALELKFAEAEAEFEEALKIDSDGVDAHMALGRALTQEGKDGSSHLRRAVELDPTNADALFELAHVLSASPEAVSFLKRAVVERPTFAAAYRLLASTELALGHLAEAKKAAESGLAIDPQDLASHLVVGDVALAENRFDDALREGQAASTLMGNSAAARLLMADAYAHKNEIDLALENYQAAYGFDHTSPAPLVRATLACIAAGRPTSAKAFGEKVTQEFPEWAPGWVALGDALVAYADNASARRAYEQAKKTKGPVDGATIDRKLATLKP